MSSLSYFLLVLKSLTFASLKRKKKRTFPTLSAFNITVLIPPASRTNGNGNFELPSGRLLHAFKIVELRLWIFECAVFLEYWKELRGMFPQVKLLLRQPKRYKKLYLPVFGVALEDVVYFTGGWPLKSEPYPLPIPSNIPDPYPLPNVFSTRPLC